MRTHNTFKTRLCDVLAIEYPIIQSGMADIAGPELAAEVSRAGGLGIVSGTFCTADQLREAIRTVRARTDRPFGVNLLLPPELRSPVFRPDDASLDKVQAALSPIRTELGMPPARLAISPLPELIPTAFEVILDERVPVFSCGLGNPGRTMTDECHRRGIKVIVMVTNKCEARIAEAAGADAVVAQGAEAGGHRSYFHKPRVKSRSEVATVTLTPEVADAVSVPVIAAGGLADGRGLVAALALGAHGVLMGTRFVATRESMAPDTFKKAILTRSANSTTLTESFSGRSARVLANEFTSAYESSNAPILPFPWQYLATGDIRREAITQGNTAYQAMWAGQSVGLIHDLPGAAAVVEKIIAEARTVLKENFGHEW